MHRILLFLTVAIFSIFLGSQIAEACLLVPYWKSLSTNEFYAYYSEFGPSFGKFFTILTLMAALISIGLFAYCFGKKSSALRYSAMSFFFALLFVALFYLYFKNANEQFYLANLNASQLQLELMTWEKWHWLRVSFEVMSLIFLILTCHTLAINEIPSNPQKVFKS